MVINADATSLGMKRRSGLKMLSEEIISEVCFRETHYINFVNTVKKNQGLKLWKTIRRKSM